jgi:cell wall-associated NlpC family hydrolase
MNATHRIRVAARIGLFLAAALAALMLTTAAAPAASGGLGTSPVTKDGGRFKKAKLVHGRAIPPKTAPKRIRKAIRAANKIRRTRYVWGGGHGSFKSKGYDCSGAVSYMLHGGRMLKSPMTSGSLASSWGRRGKGKWLTVYANGGHTYAVIAGLRWDTSGGPGPRWHDDMRSNRGFRKRNYKGL